MSITKIAPTSSIILGGLSIVVALFVLSSTPAYAAKNLIVNGNFEQGFTTCTAGVTSLPGWTVVAGNIDIGDDAACPGTGPNGAAGETFYVDLTGSGAENGTNDVGVIAQPITTVIGQQYRLSFYFGGNAEWQGYMGVLPNDSALKAMAVYVNGAISGVYSVQTAGVSVTDAQWKFREINFTASSTTTIITFQSLNGSTTNPSDFGPFLADVVCVPLAADDADARTAAKDL
jgi:hypothetical protein